MKYFIRVDQKIPKRHMEIKITDPVIKASIHFTRTMVLIVFKK